MPPQPTEILPVAPLWRRLAALIYDAFILLALTMLYGFLVTALHAVIFGTPKEKDYQPMIDTPLVLLGLVLTLGAFYVFFWRRAGQTVGMRAWRLLLVDATSGNKPKLKSVIIRACFGPVSLAAGGLGYFWMWLDSNNQCLHDRLSGTQIVVTPKPQKK